MASAAASASAASASAATAWLAAFLRPRLRDLAKLDKANTYIATVFESPVLPERDKMSKLVQALESLCKPDALEGDVNALAKTVFDACAAAGRGSTAAAALPPLLAWSPPPSAQPAPAARMAGAPAPGWEPSPGSVPPWLRGRTPSERPPPTGLRDPEPGQIVAIRACEEPGWVICPFNPTHVLPHSTLLKHLVTSHPDYMKAWVYRTSHIEALAGSAPAPSVPPPPPPPSASSEPEHSAEEWPASAPARPPEPPVSVDLPQRASFARLSDDEDEDRPGEEAPLPSDITHERTVEITELTKMLAQGVEEAKSALLALWDHGTKSEKQYALGEVVAYSDQLIGNLVGLEFVEKVLMQGSIKQATEVVRQMRSHVLRLATHELGHMSVIAVIYRCENEVGAIVDELKEDIPRLAATYCGLCVIKAVLSLFIDLVAENSAILMRDYTGLALIQYIVDESMHGEFEQARKKIWSTVMKSVPALLQDYECLVLIELLLQASPLKDQERLINEILDAQIEERPAVVALMADPQFSFIVPAMFGFANEFQKTVIEKQLKKHAADVRAAVLANETLAQLLVFEGPVKAPPKKLLPVQFALDDSDDEAGTEEAGPRTPNAAVGETVGETARAREGVADISVPKVYKSVTVVVKAVDDDDEDEGELLELYPNLDVNVVAAQDRIMPDEATANTVLAVDDQWIMYESDTQDYMQPEWNEMQTFLDTMESNRFHKLMNLKEDADGGILWQKGNICLANVGHAWVLAEIINISKDRQTVMLHRTSWPEPIILGVEHIRPVLQAPSQEVLRETTGSEGNLRLGFGGHGPRKNRSSNR